ncbi:putative terminase large subunit [Brevibacillus phage SecTim467]|uniref:Putative terminase large subunit n=2 Tax=Jenstvirus jenst TaxID=1982225 RepID=A0A0K2CP20_9CAUD|nr:putative terminase large subunit [Brevibacillus phage Jenst]ALA07151.1 putative terminase large subunit [Brevibacillus phage Jenst]ALA07521.1 putative terminase large subunit [Brevibacillus phage SecTim467]
MPNSLLSSLWDDVISMAESVNSSQGLWREEPVGLVEFFEKYLGEKPFPGKQTELLEYVEKILAKDTLPEDDPLKMVTEFAAMWGKGSGKDFIISGIVAYIPYRLNCMNDPQGYFGFGQGEPIDIINLAKNAKQAENVFFTKLKARLNSCTWFKKVDRKPMAYNEYQEKKDTIVFYNEIRAFSGHSEAGSFEGFNPLVGIFDEVGDFEWNLAEFAYDTIRSSAMSRYGKRALLLFISFPRSAEDFMMYKYQQGQDSEFPEVMSSIGASWEINPNIKREDLEMDFQKDEEGAKMRYQCIPPAQRGGFFQYPERIDDCVKKGKVNCAVLEEITITSTLADGQERHFVGYDVELFRETLELDASKTFYLGLDGGITSDSYTLSLTYGETFYEQVVQNGEAVEKARNKPVEVLLIEWKPDKKHKMPVSVQNVIDIVEIICETVYVKQALMDKFNSGAMVQKLMDLGVEAEDKVFSNPFQLVIYTNFKNLAYTGHLELLDDEVANSDMKHILLVNGTKIDHEKDRGKDTADARTASIYLCSTAEPDEVTNWSMPSIQGVSRR